MTCDELLRWLTELAEGVLPPNLCEELRSHLQDCSPCSELDRDLADLARLCRECDPPRLPAALRRRLEDRIRAWTERG
ncbi:MAG TPA: zf-HC2 domain-containing protein [Vicinamibacteria bacterium]|jgi:hypothetical protein|nr:zf-HC2 domain-containing protein [Vicinamibacteria bacterium]